MALPIGKVLKTVAILILSLHQITSPIQAQGRDTPAILHFVREVQENYNLDLVFILDSSPYVTESSFHDTEREIVRQIIQHFIYIAPERTRVSIVTYSDTVSTVFDDITNGGDQLKCDFVENSDIWLKVKYHTDETSSGSVNLAKAFETVETIMNTGRQNRRQLRPSLKQVALILTAGKFYNTGEREAAKQAAIQMQQDYGVTLHAILLDNADYHNVRDLLQIKDFLSYSTDWPQALGNQFNNIGSFYSIGKTSSGTAQGQRCRFPFLYKSTLYTGCTTRDNGGVPWCATTSTYQDVWGVCVVDSADDLRPYNSSACNCQGGAQCLCDVVKGFSRCLCPPGQTLTNGACTSCPPGTYKESFGNEACDFCPPGGDTSGGAKRRSQCLCNGVDCYDECTIRDHCTGKHRECATTQDRRGVECRCIKGYIGSSCDVVKDECDPTPCAPSSQCIDGQEDYVCMCPRERYGKNCTQFLNPNSCSNIHCPPNAECQIINLQPSCQCKSGFIKSGKNCLSPATTMPYTPPARISTKMYFNPVTPTTKPPNQRDNVNDVIPDAATDNSEEPPNNSGLFGLNGDNKSELRLLITIPVCVIAFIAISSTIYALYSVSHNKKKVQQRQRSRSNSRADTISEVTQFTASTTVSMSDLKKKTEGFNVNMDAVYGNEPVEYGMGEWYYYTLDLIHNGILNTVAIVRLDGKKWILSPGCYLYKEEIETIYSALTQKSINVRLSYQRREYGVINNDEMLMVAHSTSNESDNPQEILCAAKTRQFVVICTATFIGDDGKCKIETQRLREHIKGQGL